jgi:CPA2 family monovalent cation:H+ antiporter-2
VVAPLVAVTQPFLPALPGAVALAVLSLALGISLWRSLTNLQLHARAGAQALVEVLAEQARSEEHAPAHGFEDLYRVLPGLGSPVPVRIEAGSPVLGRTLGELDLRGLTGATVLAIVHGREGVLIPTGHEQLREGDLLALAGTREAVEAAQRLLVEKEPGRS